MSPAVNAGESTRGLSEQVNVRRIMGLETEYGITNVLVLRGLLKLLDR